MAHSFDVPVKDKKARAEFQLADDPAMLLVAIQPKSALLLPLAKMAGGDDDLANAQVIEAFLDLVMEPESREYLQGRLMDPEDNLDVEDLTPIIQWLQETWTERPTGPRRGSGPQRRRTGQRSTAGVRSTA